ncbi:MAG: winged helix-turn-helix domain-containing protein [Rhodothermales bacterium]|nr:winged helix-turn-helix domain-containing protein [Rhodothermales bacterium]
MPSSRPLPLVADDAALEAAVRVSLSPEHPLKSFALAGVTDERNTLSGHGRAIVEAAERAGLLLVAWQLAAAPVINTLSWAVRARLAGPVVAVCRNHAEAAAALAAGADAFALLPLDVPLLHARSVAYRRLVAAAAGQAAPPTPDRDILLRPPFQLDRTAHRAFVRGEEVTLTPREFALLEYLVEHAGALRTRDQILDAVWGITFDTGTNMVDVYMHFVRKKLEAFGVRDAIQTVRGRGYRLVLPDENPTAPASG